MLSRPSRTKQIYWKTERFSEQATIPTWVSVTGWAHRCFACTSCHWKSTDSVLLLRSSRTTSFHPLKQFHGMASVPPPPWQSPLQSCEKLWPIPCWFFFKQFCHATVKLWFRLNKVDVKSVNAKNLSEDITKTMEIKYKHPLKHKLQNWVSGFSIKLMPESSRSLWNFQGVSVHFLTTNSRIIDSSLSCSTPALILSVNF